MKRVVLIIPLGVMLIACGGGAPIPDIPAIQTQAARDVLATITAQAPTPLPSPTAATVPTPTATETPAQPETPTPISSSPTVTPITPTSTPISPSITPTPILPTSTPIPPTPTPIPPTSTPVPPTPTPIPPSPTPIPPTPTATNTLLPTPTSTPKRHKKKWDCDGDLYNCGDFSSCEEVMSYWNACPGDPSRLDGDKDGIPCESLCK